MSTDAAHDRRLLQSVQTPSAGAPRDVALDIFKSLLVIGMVAGHTIQLAVLQPSAIERAFSAAINLLTFSGFVFAYGAGVGLSKDGRPGRSGRKLLRVLEIYVAYLTSSLAFIVLENGAWPTPMQFGQMAVMARLYGFSEFLASFVVLGALVLFLRPQLKRWGTHPAFVIAILTVSVASTFLTYSGDAVPILPTMVGTVTFTNFPILPYAIWFLAGLNFAARGQAIGRAAVIFGVIGTAAMIGWFWLFGRMPSRFPPSFLWVAGGSLPILGYLVAAKLLARLPFAARRLGIPGKYTLSLLVGSNVALFALDRFGKLDLNVIALPLFVIGLILTILAIRSILLKIATIPLIARP